MLALRNAFLIAGLLLAFLPCAANAQQTIMQYKLNDQFGTPVTVTPNTPLPTGAASSQLVATGYCQLSVTATTAVALSACTGGIPATTTSASITVSGTNIRYRADGPAPTTTVGIPLLQGQQAPFSLTNLGIMQFIAQTGTATLDIGFYAL